jgi:hypothetical protein
MNNRIQTIIQQSNLNNQQNNSIVLFEEKFAELIVQECIGLIRQEWVELNSLWRAEDESTRDTGIRVGKKLQCITLINVISDHFGVDK